MKEIIIMRGLPGSGKSTRAAELAGTTGLIFSTDEFFLRDGHYEFDRFRLKEAHQWNQQRVENAAANGVPLIVVDNTNVTQWEMAPYIRIAQTHGYAVRFKYPQTPWQFDPQELARRNTHGVPYEAIVRAMERWQPQPFIALPVAA
jgi:NEDD4-binding protein 2